MKTTRELSVENQEIKSELSVLESQTNNAVEKLSAALTWKLKMSTHIVTLASGITRKYISIDSGMPRDCKVALLEGKNHSITVKAISRDRLYIATEKKPLDKNQESYNANTSNWELACSEESKKRVKAVLSSCGGFDDLWGYTLLLERNNEIKLSNVFFD